MLNEGGDSAQSRIAWGWETVTGRQPSNAEQQLVAATLAGFQQRYASSPDEAQAVITYGESKPDKQLNPTELAAYTLVANLLLNLDEAINKN